jgi:hypothetical protein
MGLHEDNLLHFLSFMDDEERKTNFNLVLLNIPVTDCVREKYFFLFDRFHQKTEEMKLPGWYPVDRWWRKKKLVEDLCILYRSRCIPCEQ